jgi:hypothetical protein
LTDGTPETLALQRLSACKWINDGAHLTQVGQFTKYDAQALKEDLGAEAREALGFVLLGSKVVLKAHAAQELFKLEHLPLDVVLTKAEALQR